MTTSLLSGFSTFNEVYCTCRHPYSDGVWYTALDPGLSELLRSDSQCQQEGAIQKPLVRPIQISYQFRKTD